MKATAQIAVRATTAEIWTAILVLHRKSGRWTTTDVVVLTRAKTQMVTEYVNRLISAGYVAVVDTQTRPRFRRVFELKTVQRDAPRISEAGVVLPETINDIVWRTIKMLRTGITTTALAEAVAALGRETNRESIGSYVRKLSEVGVLQLTAPKRGQAPATYRLAMKLGAGAPKLLKADLVYDPNSRQILGVADAREAL